MLFAPSRAAFSAVNPGEMAAFTWRIRPQAAADGQAVPIQEAILWLHLNYVPLSPALNVFELAEDNVLMGVEPTHELIGKKKAPLEDPGSDGNPEQLRRLLAAPGFSLKVHSFLGLSGMAARVVGGVFLPFGLVLTIFPWSRRFFEKAPKPD